MRAYALPPTVTADEYGRYTEELIEQLEAEALDYLAQKTKEVKGKGVENVESIAGFGYGAEEIIKIGRQTPDNLIAMCTHGRSGIKRWVLGSVTERVVREILSSSFGPLKPFHLRRQRRLDQHNSVPRRGTYCFRHHSSPANQSAASKLLQTCAY
jgi:hypothetical protein